MRSLLISFALAVLLGSPAQAADHYYLAFFASQDDRASPSLSHTFASFVKASFDDPSNPNEVSAVESFTISWLPATGQIRLLAAPEPGRNFTLAESKEWADKNGTATTSWGPYEMHKEGFDGAKREFARLRSGEIAFKALDRAPA